MGVALPEREDERVTLPPREQLHRDPQLSGLVQGQTEVRHVRGDQAAVLGAAVVPAGAAHDGPDPVHRPAVRQHREPADHGPAGLVERTGVLPRVQVDLLHDLRRVLRSDHRAAHDERDALVRQVVEVAERALIAELHLLDERRQPVQGEHVWTHQRDSGRPTLRITFGCYPKICLTKPDWRPRSPGTSRFPPVDHRRGGQPAESSRQQLSSHDWRVPQRRVLLVGEQP